MDGMFMLSQDVDGYRTGNSLKSIGIYLAAEIAGQQPPKRFFPMEIRLLQ